MSFDLSISRFREGAPDTFPESIVREVFSGFVASVDGTCWRLFFDEQNACDVFGTVSEDVPGRLAGLTVAAPCRDLRLWDGLISILRVARMVLYSPEGQPLIADVTTIEHMPEDMLKALGPPRCVTTGKDLRAAIEGS